MGSGHTLLAFLLPATTQQDKRELGAIFEAPGSKWEVRDLGDEQFLALRQTGPIPDAVADVAVFSGPAYRHLKNALKILDGPQGENEPWIAYLEAVKAVEAVAGPIISPNDPRPSLGTLLPAMRDKEEKWALALPSESVADVARRMEILWKTPHERHGSNDPPPAVTPEQARAGFALALNLVDYFTRGLIYAVEQ